MLGQYWKAAIAFVGVIVVGFGSLSASTDFTAVSPSGLSAAIVVAGGAVTGFLGWLKRNQKTIDQVDTAVKSSDFTVKDLEDLIDKYKK